MKQPTLADLKAFIAVASERSFRRAADALGISHSALSHAIRGLESTLGARLLNRTTRSVSLTQEGERLLGRLLPLLNELDVALGDVSAQSGQPSGLVRINGSDGAIRLLLEKVVPQFHRRYPQVELDLVAQGQLVDIVERGFDAGIRLGEAVPKDMVAVRLGDDIRFLAVASPSYLANAPALNTPDDLHDHRCIRLRLPSGKRYRWEFSKDAQEIIVDVPGLLTLDSNPLMIEAAAAGLGIAYVPDSFAAPLLTSGHLVAVLKEWCPSIPGLFLYFPSNRHMPQGLRALVDMVKGLG